MPATKSPVAADLTAIVLVVWTAGNTRPEVTVCLEVESAVFIARNAMERNAERMAGEQAARAALAHMPEIAAQLPVVAKVTCQVKRLHGARAWAVLSASSDVERAFEDEETSPARQAAAQAALVDSYLLA